MSVLFEAIMTVIGGLLFLTFIAVMCAPFVLAGVAS